MATTTTTSIARGNRTTAPRHVPIVVGIRIRFFWKHLVSDSLVTAILRPIRSRLVAVVATVFFGGSGSVGTSVRWLCRRFNHQSRVLPILVKVSTPTIQGHRNQQDDQRKAWIGSLEHRANRVDPEIRCDKVSHSRLIIMTHTHTNSNAKRSREQGTAT